jgi:hypothetical protein
MHNIIVSNSAKPSLRRGNGGRKCRVVAHISLIHFKPRKACDSKNTTNDQNITEIYNASLDLILGGKEHLLVT